MPEDGLDDEHLPGAIFGPRVTNRTYGSIFRFFTSVAGKGKGL